MGRTSVYFYYNKSSKVGCNLLDCYGVHNEKNPKNAAYSSLIEIETEEDRSYPVARSATMLIHPDKFFVKTVPRTFKGGRNFILRNKTVVQAKNGSYCQLYVNFCYYLKALRRKSITTIYGEQCCLDFENIYI